MLFVAFLIDKDIVLLELQLTNERTALQRAKRKQRRKLGLFPLNNVLFGELVQRRCSIPSAHINKTKKKTSSVLFAERGQ